MKRITPLPPCRTLCSLTLVLALGASLAPGQNPAPIFKGVSRVWTNGAVSALTGIPGKNVLPVISGDQDTRLPGLFAAIGSLGKGSVLAVGHGGMFGDTANGVFDTLKFNLQAIAWLDTKTTKTVAILAGHAEWSKKGKMGVLVTALVKAGYKVLEIRGRVTSTSLKGVGVVIVGNAWGSFTATELTLFETHVKGGGGMYLAGVGWSWNAYRSSKGFDNYPMNVLGRRFGLTWLTSGISDPTNNYKGSPVFHTFYPNSSLYMPDIALKHLDTVLGSHNLDLDSWLRGNATERTKYLIAVGQVAIALAQLPVSGSVRANFDIAIRKLLIKNSGWLGMAPAYSPTKDAVLAISRAVLHGNLIAAFPLTKSRIATITPALGIKSAHPDYGEILNKYGIILLDNRGLNAAQRTSIKDLLSLVAKVPKTMHRMTIKSKWGKALPDLSRALAGAGVNTFGVGMQAMENGFPKDVPVLRRPTFTIALAHEVAHSINAAMNRVASYKSAQKKLIKDAGLDNQQYLRSMVGGAFFQKAPQEFIASNANQWIIDSAHTLRVGLTRWRANKGEPILQALFMLDLYGQYASTAPLFTTAIDGRITTIQASLTRDTQGRVTDVQSRDATLRIRYGSTGKVQKLSAALAYGSSSKVLGVDLGAKEGPWVGNQSFAFTGTAPAASTPGLLLLGPKPADIALPGPIFTGRLQVDLTAALIIPLVSTSTKGFVLQVPIPDKKILLASRLYAQAIFYRKNPAAQDLFGVSRGLELWLGAK